MDVLALILSGLAIGFSVFAFFRQFALQRRLAEIEEARRTEEIASKLAADVTVDLKGVDFVFHNRGPAMATDVNIQVRTPGVDIIREATRLALRLDAGQTFRVPALAAWSGPAMEADLRWTDGTGPRLKTLVLPLP